MKSVKLGTSEISYSKLLLVVNDKANQCINDDNLIFYLNDHYLNVFYNVHRGAVFTANVHTVFFSLKIYLSYKPHPFICKKKKNLKCTYIFNAAIFYVIYTIHFRRLSKNVILKGQMTRRKILSNPFCSFLYEEKNSTCPLNPLE